MLKKNVYIFYPPGYCGNFINWAIHAADIDSRKTTVDNPINTSSSKQLGGVGTAHLHVRIPTHQAIHLHYAWVLYNKPTEYKVYPIASDNEQIIRGITGITHHDRDGIFIVIHNDNNDDVDSFALINTAIKWPTYIDAKLKLKTDVRGNHVESKVNFDPYNCGDSREFRNWMIDNDLVVFPHNNKLQPDLLQQSMDNWSTWYDARHSAQPHEVNEDTYIVRPSLENRIFQLSCLDVCGQNFIPWFKDFMEKSQASDSYDFAQVEKVHPQYIGAQTNLQWFSAIDTWKRTGEIEPFLLSHSSIEAQFIKVIFKLDTTNLHERIDWRNMTTVEISEHFRLSKS